MKRNGRIGTRMAAAVALAAAALCAWWSADAAVRPKESTPEEKAARAQRRLDALNTTGGFIADPREAKGKFVFVDFGVGIDENVLKAAAIKCQNSCLIKTEVVRREKKGPFSFAAGDAAFATLGGELATFLIDEEGWPMEVVCPESGWAAVNVRALKADNPGKGTLETRVRKMMSRSLGQVFQAGYAFSSVSTMNLVRSLADLDRIATEGLATECTTVVQVTAEKFGFRPMRRVLYRTACQEGWAPPPVNDYQRSAWKKVHEIPTKPITIEYDPKVDK